MAAKRGKGNKADVSDEPQTPAERRASMTWAQRLKRVFNTDIETCRECGGVVKVIACIEGPAVIKKILDHLKDKAESNATFPLPESRPLASVSSDYRAMENMMFGEVPDFEEILAVLQALQEDMNMPFGKI